MRDSGEVDALSTHQVRYKNLVGEFERNWPKRTSKASAPLSSEFSKHLSLMQDPRDPLRGLQPAPVQGQAVKAVVFLLASCVPATRASQSSKKPRT